MADKKVVKTLLNSIVKQMEQGYTDPVAEELLVRMKLPVVEVTSLLQLKALKFVIGRHPRRMTKPTVCVPHLHSADEYLSISKFAVSSPYLKVVSEGGKKRVKKNRRNLLKINNRRFSFKKRGKKLHNRRFSFKKRGKKLNNRRFFFKNRGKKGGRR